MADRRFKAGTRSSALALAQTRHALRFLAKAVPGTAWRAVAIDTPGDRDLVSPIEKSAPDFFTRDLDEAVRSGRVDCAVHSAKDLPGYSGAASMVADGLDWFWLPCREDPRDCMVYADAPAAFSRMKHPRIGVSSARRRDYVRRKFPGARLLPVRGAIDSRIRQMLEGRFDALLMAAAGLNRLFKTRDGSFSFEGKTVQCSAIPETELRPPEAQGVLAVAFRKGDRRFEEMRSHFVKAVRFVSAGVGDAGLCTLAGLRDIASADTVLYDALMGSPEDFREAVRDLGGRAGMDSLRQSVFIPVGKRCGERGASQDAITARICDEARKGRRVVRLKGGDAGIFGRLAEETGALEALGIPFVVRPGVSALSAATTGTGMLLTRRGVSRGFSVHTPRSKGEDMPRVVFMAANAAAEEARAMIASGMPASTPCAIVFDAAGPREEVWRGTLGRLARGDAPDPSGRPGLLIAGSAAEKLWPRLGLLAGKRVLLTCTHAVQPHLRTVVEDFGGRPVMWPMIEMRPRKIPSPAGYGAIVLTSPSAVRIFFETCNPDRRQLPLFFTCGAGTDAELRRYGVGSDLTPEKDFSAAGLVAEIAKRGNALRLRGMKILRLRSAKAGSAVADTLVRAGADVDDAVLYDNVPVGHDAPLPPFDAVHFASASAVAAFLDAYGTAPLRGKDLFVMGEPTRAALPRALRRRARRLITGTLR